MIHALPAARTISLGRTGGVLACCLLILAPGIEAGAQEASDETLNTSHGYSNFGELKYGPDAVLDYVNPDAPKGGEFSTWSIGNFDTFNPYARAGRYETYSASVGAGEYIMTSTADDPYAAYCYLCTTVEWPDDLSYVIFNLREDVTFQDGTPMTAEDIAFSHKLILEQAIPEYRERVGAYFESVEVLGPYRIRFDFTDSAPMRDRVTMAGGTPAWSKTWFEETETRLDESSTAPFMSTGPYVLDSVDWNRQVVYAKNPDYWGEDLPINTGRNNFDRIRVEYFADSSAALEAFKAGEYLFRIESDPADWNTNYNFRALNQGYVVREEIPDGSVAPRLSWVFNLNREKWQDPRVRRAISMMFNFAWSNQTLYYGAYAQPVSFWTGTDLAAEGLPSEEERVLLDPLVEQGLLEESVVADPVPLPVEHDASTSRPSRKILREATALLEEAGWEIGPNGTRQKDGRPLDLTILQFDPRYDKVILPFIENLGLLGISGKLERVDTTQYVQRRQDDAFDLTTQGFQMDFEPSDALRQWYGSQTADTSSRNLMRLKSEAVDDLITDIVAADTLDTLRPGVKALDRVLRHIGFDIPLYYNPVTWLAYYDVYSHPEELPPLAVGALDFWWYDEERAQELRSAGAF
ncbi:microcin C transport system substrate-binding protein [Palleronia aestuarii]|uniref:Microcin C transport system substrate-binding protein n=1 Tax=Palleronia aestuarii TaxID=568105 RepID=A0A2W7P8B7_9RHOB|nr:extracellular solute-binding protein [Palleronia aestuarii]PZX19642.1 microcin C transport system substrate-binding protein [Palleronia aestuarii]